MDFKHDYYETLLACDPWQFSLKYGWQRAPRVLSICQNWLARPFLLLWEFYQNYPAFPVKTLLKKAYFIFKMTSPAG